MSGRQRWRQLVYVVIMKIFHIKIVCNECNITLFEMQGNETAINALSQIAAQFVGLQHAPAHTLYPNLKANIRIEATELTPQIERPNGSKILVKPH